MFTTVLFYILAVILIIAGARVITATSPVTAVLHLILTFFTASMLWLLLGAEFLALLLVLVYVGAVMVLFLFVVMMIDITPANLRSGFKTYLPLGLIVGGVMVLEIAFVLGNMYLGSGPSISMPADYDNTRELGIALYSRYSYAVQIGAVTLLVGMIAAIALTLRERRNRKYVTSDQQLHVKASDRLKMVNIPSQREVPTAEEQDAKPAGEGK